jgi:hypothetical protein
MDRIALSFALLSGVSLTHAGAARAQDVAADTPPLVQAQVPPDGSSPEQGAAPPPLDQVGGAPGGSSLPDPSAPGDQPLANVELPPTVVDGPLTAWGDTFEASNLVLARPRPGLDPQGLPIGSFTLFPAFKGSAGYDDNVFAVDRGKVGSGAFALEPSLLLSRQTPVDSLSLAASGLVQRYSNASVANYETFSLRGDGVRSLSSSVAVQADAYFNRKAEPRGTAGDIAVNGEPIIYYNPGGAVEVLAGNGRIQLRAGGSIERFSYNDAQIGGTRFSQTYRNHNSFAGNGQVGFQLSPAILAFVSGAYDREQYHQQAGTTRRSSDGYSVLAGLDFRITKLIRGRVGVGYLWRNYQEPSFASLNGLNYDAAIVWNPTTLVTVTVKAAKTVEESPSIGISGIVANTFSGSVDWELTRKIILSGSLDYVREKYRAIDRTDHRIAPSVGARYLANRNLTFDLSYDYRQQYGPGFLVRRYKENVVTFGITVQR